MLGVHEFSKLLLLWWEIEQKIVWPILLFKYLLANYESQQFTI